MINIADNDNEKKKNYDEIGGESSGPSFFDPFKAFLNFDKRSESKHNKQNINPPPNLINPQNPNTSNMGNNLGYIKNLPIKYKKLLKEYLIASKISDYLNSGKAKKSLSKNKQYEKNVKYIENLIYSAYPIYSINYKRKNKKIIKPLNKLNEDFEKWLIKNKKSDTEKNFIRYINRKLYKDYEKWLKNKNKKDTEKNFIAYLKTL